jgi:hypothetical protein
LLALLPAGSVGFSGVGRGRNRGDQQGTWPTSPWALIAWVGSQKRSALLQIAIFLLIILLFVTTGVLVVVFLLSPQHLTVIVNVQPP